MAEREHYEVDVHGIKHTFLLTAEDAKRRYPGAKRVEDPAAGSDAEKLRQEFNHKANARPAEGEGDAEEKAKTPANKSRAAANKTA